MGGREGLLEEGGGGIALRGASFGFGCGPCCIFGVWLYPVHYIYAFTILECCYALLDSFFTKD